MRFRNCSLPTTTLPLGPDFSDWWPMGHLRGSVLSWGALATVLAFSSPPTLAAEMPGDRQGNDVQPVSNLSSEDSEPNRSGLSPLPASSADSETADPVEIIDLSGISTQAVDLFTETPVSTESVSAAEMIGQALAPHAEKDAETESDRPLVAQAGGSDSTSTSQAELAKKSQNPIASLISVPLQNNTNFGVGEFDRTSNILNVQPVIPTRLSEHLTLVSRTIIPIAYQPELAPGLGSAFGLGDINYTGFFVPQTTGNFTWGVGPSLLLPTATDPVLGTGKWSAGPAAVGLVTQGRIVTGALVSQLWSFAGDGDRTDISLLTVQPFFNYNFEAGWYATTSPIVNANWLATGEKWTVPLGGGFGRVFKIGSQPVNVSLQAYWNVVRPEGTADWTLRAQFTLLFP